ncbi:uncharacterized protein LOC111391610 [Olea europaea var. sylvestris]|uniref:uncharacterized protein LOC111391610 n=1 Tax=Olea europaea var. sylvestris TaxID=158386 RepID=UPI000C1D1C69|nr:uncharacterized protein LOC111391610 [Olea europaea var. sylvestris]
MWEVVAALPYLDRELSPPKYRSFFIPYLWQQKNVFGLYKLLKRLPKSETQSSTLLGYELHDWKVSISTRQMSYIWNSNLLQFERGNNFHSEMYHPYIQLDFT